MKTSTQFFNWRKAIKQSELPASTRLVLFVIADYANAMDDVCWPSMERIAGDAGLSVRCVADHIRIAEAGGWLTSWLTRRANRRHAHSCYRLSVPADVAARFRASVDFELADELAEDSAACKFTPDTSLFADDSAIDVSSFAGGQPPVMSSFADESQSSGFDFPDGAANAAVSSEPGSGGVARMQNLPTNTPVNRNTNKPSLQQPTAVNEETREAEREFQQKDEALASWMLERLRRLNAGFREPDLRAWAADIEEMRHADGRTHEQIAVLFRWANEDAFWHKVVLSPAKLRHKWDDLVIRRNAAKRAVPSQTAAPPPADDRQCAHVEHGRRCTHIATTIIGAGSSRRGYCREHIGFYED
ncbi:helix-turn-helix domain-containing protein [Caballeronia sp. KNU42]